MSRTIVTKSGTDFFTNVASEDFIGLVCKNVGAKFYEHETFKGRAMMAFHMTATEADDAANRIEPLLQANLKDLEEYTTGFNKPVEIYDHLEWLIETLRASRGYECI